MLDQRSGRALRIALLGYRSAPFSGGQGVYLRYLSQALMALGHEVTVISGPPYPDLVDTVRLVKLPSLDLYARDLGSVTLILTQIFFLFFLYPLCLRIEKKKLKVTN